MKLSYVLTKQLEVAILVDQPERLSHLSLGEIEPSLPRGLGDAALVAVEEVEGGVRGEVHPAVIGFIAEISAEMLEDGGDRHGGHL